MTSFKAKIKRRAEELSRTGLPDSRVFQQLKIEFPERRPRRIWREMRGLTGAEVAELCAERGLSADTKKVSLWDTFPSANNNSLNLNALLALSVVLDAPIRLLVDEVDLNALSPLERNHIESLLTIQTENLGVLSQQEFRDSDFAEIAAAVAARSEEHSNISVAKESNAVDTNHLLERAKNLAQDHLHINSLELFRETHFLREDVYKMLENASAHTDKNDLFLLASLLSCLLADTCISLGSYSQAKEITRAAYRYADIAGHNELRYWSKAKLEGIIYRHQEKYQRAIDCARSCEIFAKTPTLKIQHHNTLASYYAYAGHEDATRYHLDQLGNAREQLTDKEFLSDEVGGMFAYPSEKEDEVRSGTLLKLGRYSESEAAGLSAIKSYAANRPKNRAFGNESLARVNVATSRIMLSGDYEAAIEALEPVFSLPSEKRQAWFVSALVELGSKIQGIGDNGFRKTELCGKIEEFSKNISSDYKDELALIQK